jgi:aquaporin Z
MSSSEREFLDPSRAWRRFFAEFWGTFLLVFAVACGDVASVMNPGQATHLQAAIASGFMVTVAIYFLGSVSGAHLNPAITFAFALRGNFP